MKEASGLTGQRRRWTPIVLTGAAGCGLLLLLAIVSSAPKGPLAEARIADGRIIVVEAVTFGTNHVVGRRSFFVERFGPWMPPFIRRFLEPKVPRSDTRLDEPGLVVWVNALDPVTRTNVDCQGIRVEFEDSQGDLWGVKTSGWTSFENKFSRVGHVFDAYPRSEPELTLRIVPWRTNVPVSLKVPNPQPARAVSWVGESLPARRKVEALEIVLAGLSVRTNGGPKRNWETPSKFWQPEWQILFDGKPAEGWRDPEWTAKDPFGNWGQRLGLHQPVLRYSAKFVPAATNVTATEFVTSLPSVSCAPDATNSIWFRTNWVKGREIVVIGLMTATMTHFTDGQYDPKPSMPMGPTRGGAPTGWVGSSRHISPAKVQNVRGHYADRPVIYLQCRDRDLRERLGVRLRDAQGRVWPTTREPQGNPAGIIPFMLDVPTDVTSVVPEIVRLKPVEAEFTVKTPGGNNR